MERFHKLAASPAFWFVFGLLGFPILCFCGQLMMWALLLRLEQGRSSSPGGWGGASGAYFGPLLGTVAAVVADEWERGAHSKSRRIAGSWGAFLGIAWGWHLLRCDPFVWLGDFGCAVPPLAWSAGLVLFGVLARHSGARSQV